MADRLPFDSTEVVFCFVRSDRLFVFVSVSYKGIVCFGLWPGPFLQILRVVDGNTWKIFKGGGDEKVVIINSDDGWIRVEARNDGVHEARGQA
jgi:hypothetical protein